RLRAPRLPDAARGRAGGLTADGRVLVVIDDHEVIHHLDIPSGRELRRIDLNRDWRSHFFRRDSYFPCARYLVSAYDDGPLVVLETATGAVLLEIPAPDRKGADSFCFSGDGRYFVARCLRKESNDAVIGVWDLADRKQVASAKILPGAYSI